MLDFIKYINPGWYFNHKILDIPYYVDFTKLDSKIIEKLSKTFHFEFFNEHYSPSLTSLTQNL